MMLTIIMLLVTVSIASFIAGGIVGEANGTVKGYLVSKAVYRQAIKNAFRDDGSFGLNSVKLVETEYKAALVDFKPEDINENN